jgi:hypothetical protein
VEHRSRVLNLAGGQWVIGVHIKATWLKQAIQVRQDMRAIVLGSAVRVKGSLIGELMVDEKTTRICPRMILNRRSKRSHEQLFCARSRTCQGAASGVNRSSAVYTRPWLKRRAPHSNVLRWLARQGQNKQRLVLHAALFSGPFHQDELTAFRFLPESEQE